MGEDIASPPATPAPARLARAADLAFAGFAPAACGLAARDGAAPWFDAAALAFLVHVGVSFYDGCFGRLRAVSWALLVGAWVWLELSGFLTHVLPWGQMSFWFAARLTQAARTVPIVGDALMAWLWSGGLRLVPLPPAAPLFAAVLALDIAALHRPARAADLAPALRSVAIGAVAAVLANGAGWNPLGPGDGPPPGADGIRHIVPAWFELPLYALLRVPHDKLAGVGLMFGAMALFAAWPWAGAARLRVGPWRIPFALSCTALALAWATLFWAGGQDPEVAETPARAAAAFDLAFFAFVPLLARLSPR